MYAVFSCLFLFTSEKSSIISGIIPLEFVFKLKKSDGMKNKKHIEPDWERGYFGREVKGRDVTCKIKEMGLKRKKYTKCYFVILFWRMTSIGEKNNTSSGFHCGIFCKVKVNQCQWLFITLILEEFHRASVIPEARLWSHSKITLSTHSFWGCLYVEECRNFSSELEDETRRDLVPVTYRPYTLYVKEW